MSIWSYGWLAIMLMLLVPPLLYGWGYRDWGPPLPRYFQKRRAKRAAARGASPTFDHHAWGSGGDLFWMALLIATFWAMWAALSRAR
jgi:hypothetical protein